MGRGQIRLLLRVVERIVTEIKRKIEEKLKNLDDTKVRNEYKLAVLSRYLIPSLRFILTVHDLNKTSLKSLDTLCDKYTKKWAGLPKSGTNIIIHCSHTMNIPSISHLYKEAHALTHASTRLKGDRKVNNIIDIKIAREGEWTRKTSSVCTSEALFQESSSTTSQHLPPKTKLTTIKQKVKDLTKEDSKRQQVEHARKLISQGKLIQILQEMELDASWKSFLYALPKGTMKFILNSCINTLPTRANLRLWGKISCDKCPLCGRKETTNLSFLPALLPSSRVGTHIDTTPYSRRSQRG